MKTINETGIKIKSSKEDTMDFDKIVLRNGLELLACKKVNSREYIILCIDHLKEPLWREEITWVWSEDSGANFGHYFYNDHEGAIQDFEERR